MLDDNPVTDLTQDQCWDFLGSTSSVGSLPPIAGEVHITPVNYVGRTAPDLPHRRGQQAARVTMNNDALEADEFTDTEATSVVPVRQRRDPRRRRGGRRRQPAAAGPWVATTKLVVVAITVSK